jgi:protein-disulfide isomerase
MDKRFWAIIGVIIAVFAGVLWFSGKEEKKEDEGKTTTSQATNHVKGKTDSKVTLVEYGDFQCPYCAQYYPIVEQVTQKYSDKIKFQFRNYPLAQLHLNAVSAARAAEAADMQGKYWEMYNKLYQTQTDWSESNSARTIFEGYATGLGLDLAKFKKDFASSATNDRINADKREFNELNLPKSTPTFLLNGKKIQPTSVEEFSKLIDEALKKN